MASLKCSRTQAFSHATVKRTPRCARAVQCSASQVNALTKIGQAAAASGAAALLSLGCLSGSAVASEFDILAEPTPTSNFFIDDAAVLNKVTKSDITKKLKLMEIETGFRLEVVTVRKLEIETDAFAYADKVLENWYPTPEAGNKKGLLLVVTSGKDGAVSGGPAFMEAVGDELVDSIVTSNIPIFTELERYNETVVSSVERIDAILQGKPDPGEPKRNDDTRVRTYKTKEETEKAKGVTSTIVATLLIIAFLVPMLQYYGYTARD